MIFKEITLSYEHLVANDKLLREVADKISVCNVKSFNAVEKMRKLNAEARRRLRHQAGQQFPAMMSDLKNMGKDFDTWISLLKKYPSFVRGNEKKLICLFWIVCSTDSSEAGCFAKSLLQLVVRRRIICFALRPENKSLFDALSVSVGKVVSQKQKLIFERMVKTLEKA